MPLWQAFHTRLSSGRPVRTVRVGPLNDEQRAALADLLGLSRLPGAHTQVSLSDVDGLLAPLDLSAAAVTAAVCGPIGNAAADQSARAAAREELWGWLTQHHMVRAQPALKRWADDVRRRGLIDGSVDRTRETLEQALEVLTTLPYDGRPLPQLAESCTGDPHALDADSRLAPLVLRALAAIHDEPVPVDAEQRRHVWERAGVACDALSTVVLVAGLRLPGSERLATSLLAWADAGEAAAITLAQLRTVASLDFAGGDLSVVENPSVLAQAVRRFGAECPPIVCTSGWPNGAGMLLLRLLHGARLRYHGDFDPDGIRIAAHVMALTGARPWRMSAADYRSAASARRGTTFDPNRLTDAPWDADLAPAMRAIAATVPEERVVETLLDDLAIVSG